MVNTHDLQEIAYLPLGARAIALSFHPDKPLAFISLDNDQIAYLHLDTFKIEKLIPTQKEPDVSRVISM